MDCALDDSLGRTGANGTHSHPGSAGNIEVLRDAQRSRPQFAACACGDEVLVTGIKRQHEPPRIVDDLKKSEIAEKQVRSIRYRLTITKLPLAKDIEQFDCTGTPINEGMLRELATAGSVVEQRNVVLTGSSVTKKTHLEIALDRALLRRGILGRFFNVVDLVNQLETKTRGGKQGRMTNCLTRLNVPPRASDPPDLFLTLVDPRYVGRSALRPVPRKIALPPEPPPLLGSWLKLGTPPRPRTLPREGSQLPLAGWSGLGADRYVSSQPMVPNRFEQRPAGY